MGLLLSRAASEVLAIIAYRQPITRSGIELGMMRSQFLREGDRGGSGAVAQQHVEGWEHRRIPQLVSTTAPTRRNQPGQLLTFGFTTGNPRIRRLKRLFLNG